MKQRTLSRQSRYVILFIAPRSSQVAAFWDDAIQDLARSVVAALNAILAWYARSKMR
jgi:hypothetical protein